MSNRRKNQRFLALWISRIAHVSLARRASTRGIHITELATEYIERGLVEDAEQTDDAVLKIFREAKIVKDRQTLRMQLERIAMAAIHDESQAAMDKLDQLCSDAGFTFDEIVEGAKRLGAASVDAVLESTPKMGEAMAFITSALHNGPIAAAVVKQAGEEQGFSKWMLDQAKRKLGVESVRVGKGFVWRLQSMESSTTPVQ